MIGLAAVLVVLAVLGLFVGIVLASRATAGVAVLAASCLLAIFARLAQASAHHAELIRQVHDARAGIAPSVRLAP